MVSPTKHDLTGLTYKWFVSRLRAIVSSSVAVMSKFKFVAFILFFLSSCVMANHPEEIPAYIEWDFSNSAPTTYLEFLKYAKLFQKESSAEIPLFSVEKIVSMVMKTNLEQKVGFETLLVSYEYANELENGEWKDESGLLEIAEKGGISFGHILFQLHHNTNGNLVNQDIMAIEGFEIKAGTEHDTIPTYWVFFGT